MADRNVTARAIADAFLSGAWSEASLRQRGEETLGRNAPWLSPAAKAALKGFPSAPFDQRDELVRALLSVRRFGSAIGEEREPPTIRHRFLPTPAMGPQRWPVPSLPTVGDLQRWLHVDGPEFDWFADRKGLERFATSEQLRHYRYRWVLKRTGGWRLIERPKAQMKAIQRRVLHGILDSIRPHEAAHGFREGRSVLSFATPHVGKRLVLRLDLTDFFGTIVTGRIFGLFRTAGYPEEVARTLAALCTNRTPMAVLREVETDWLTRRRFQTPHLPQGAPTSPALANLCAFGLDVRLSALSASMGATYTRYADDLAFSFDAAVSAERFFALANGIVLDEGFVPNFRKQKALTSARRQQLAGVVVNEHANVRREDYDALKATLHNCVKLGPSSQNRQGLPHFRLHLQGRISWVAMVNTARGAKLRTLFNAIDWSR